MARNNNITLSELQGKNEEVTESEKVIVDIKDITTKEPEEGNTIKKNMDNLFGDLDKAITRTKEDLYENVVSKALEQQAQEAIDKDEDEDEEETTTPVKTETSSSFDDLDEISSDNPFSFVEDDDFEEDFGDDAIDDEVEEQSKQEFEIFKKEIKENTAPVKNAIDLTKFTINKKPISVSKLLTLTDTKKHTSDWMLYTSGKCITMSELSGPEIDKFDPQVINGRNRMNAYKEIYSIIYKHLVDDNKPKSLEAWVKMIKFFDINHLYFAVYKASFEGKNIVPYACPKCGKTFTKTIDIDSMIKYKDKDVENKVKAILAKDPTSADTVEVEMIQVSDDYVIGMRTPSVYNVIFENAALDDRLTEKYGDLLGVISYIESIYYIDRSKMELVEISTNPDPLDLVKTVKRKVKIYHEILKSLNSDQYNNVIMAMRDINEKGDGVSYVIPECECEHCKSKISEVETDPLQMLFTRHRLGVIGNL